MGNVRKGFAGPAALIILNCRAALAAPARSLLPARMSSTWPVVASRPSSQQLISHSHLPPVRPSFHLSSSDYSWR